MPATLLIATACLIKRYGHVIVADAARCRHYFAAARCAFRDTRHAMRCFYDAAILRALPCYAFSDTSMMFFDAAIAAYSGSR